MDPLEVQVPSGLKGGGRHLRQWWSSLSDLPHSRKEPSLSIIPGILRELVTPIILPGIILIFESFDISDISESF